MKEDVDKALKRMAVRNYDGYKSQHTLNAIGVKFSADLKIWIGDDDEDSIISEETKLSELEKLFGMKVFIRSEYEKQLALAPNKKAFQISWLKEVEEAFCVGENGEQLKNIERRAAYVPFWDASFGFDRPIKHYAYLIYNLETNNNPSIGEFIMLMTLAFAFAYVLPQEKPFIATGSQAQTLQPTITNPNKKEPKQPTYRTLVLGEYIKRNHKDLEAKHFNVLDKTNKHILTGGVDQYRKAFKELEKLGFKAASHYTSKKTFIASYEYLLANCFTDKSSNEFKEVNNELSLLKQDE